MQDTPDPQKQVQPGFVFHTTVETFQALIVSCTAAMLGTWKSLTEAKVVVPYPLHPGGGEPTRSTKSTKSTHSTFVQNSTLPTLWDTQVSVPTTYLVV